MRKLRTLQEFLREQLADREEAIAYLQVTLEEYQVDRDTVFFLDEIHTVVEAQGGISKLSKQTGIAPQILSKVLASTDAPRIDILNAIFHALGCRLTIQTLENESPNIELTAADAVISSSIASESSSLELTTDSSEPG